MRLLAAACAALCSSIVAGCSQSAGRHAPIASLGSPIAYGTADTTHTAVVSVLAAVGSTEIAECSGSVVGVSGGVATVLTAAHCCNTYVPSVVVVSSNYAVGEQYVGISAPQPPAYPVVVGSVYYDAQYSLDMAMDHDFCMLQFSGAPAGTATLSLPQASDGLALGDAIEHVGFGETATSTTNSERFTGTDTVNLELTSLVLEWSQGGSTDTPGTCEGDSGGPALLPAGVAQAQQVVVGVTSYGPATTCPMSTYGVASRVSSAMGSGGFIASYVAGTPIGVHAGVAAQASVTAGGWAVGALAVSLLAAGTL